MNYQNLRDANAARQQEWDAGGEANNPDWRMNELAGEIGEVCNILKKLQRERVGMPGSRATKLDLAEELADVVICIDLYMMTAGGSRVNSTDSADHLVNYSLPHLGVHLQAAVGRAATRLVLNPTVTGEDQHASLTNLHTVLRGIAMREDIDLEKAVAHKFNATSRKMGLETMMDTQRKPEATPEEPIPAGTFYDAGDGCFRDFAGKDLGSEFWKKWRGRNHNFPTHPPFRD